MSALPSLAPLLGQIDHHTMWLLGAILWRLLRALLSPTYRLYIRVMEDVGPTISQGVNAEIADWFASRRQEALNSPLQEYQSLDGSLDQTSPPTV